MDDRREFDIIVYGATGYTGQLVAECLNGRAGPLKWAMAGRSRKKLEAIRVEIGAAQETSLIVADATDDKALAALAQRTKVVLTTVGPYQTHGNRLIAACVAHGTHYVDLCGEPVWMRDQIDAHHAQAQATGARICFSSGFDSIPFDLGVLILQQHCIDIFGAPAPRIKGRVRAMEGKFSGGTAASFKATMQAAADDQSVIDCLADPFCLVPGFEGPDQPVAASPEFDQGLDSWAAPFVMAPINTKNVHRTNALLGHLYGTDFVYDEMMLTGPGAQGEAIANYLATTPLIGTPDDPEPGEGPTRDERESGFFDLLFVAEYPDGSSARLAVRGDRDPGYGSTSKMIVETAIALVETTGDGGVTTPAAALGDHLGERLQAYAGLSFDIEA